MASNTAAWLTSAKAYPLEIKPAPMGEPSSNQILVRNHAVAINPIDFKVQRMAVFPLEYPTILGEDNAGEVVAVGSGVTRFKPGDRVIALSAGMSTKKDTEKSFQAYTVHEENLACHLPAEISYERGIVLPLGVSTAAAGLFNPDFLNLQLPTEPKAKSSGQVVLVWGGASSVGSATIQLAVAAGYEVFATASGKNFDRVRRLGATKVVDYNTPNAVDDLVDALKGRYLAGAFDAVGGAAWAPTVEVVRRSEGNKFIATSLRGFPDPPAGITMKSVFSLSIMSNHVGKAIWEDFLPKALQAGTCVPFPEPMIVGKGLESVQQGFDVLAKGVSAMKVVVIL